MKVEKCSTAAVIKEEPGMSYDDAMKREGIYRLADGTCTNSRLVVLRSGDYVTSFWFSEYSGIEPCVSVTLNRFFAAPGERLCMEIRK